MLTTSNVLFFNLDLSIFMALICDKSVKSHNTSHYRNKFIPYLCLSKICQNAGTEAGIEVKRNGITSCMH